MRILFVASEAAPYVKVGGLGEVMFSLPRALNALGHDARVIIPRYATINHEQYPVTTVIEGLAVPMGLKEPIMCNVKVHEKTFFLENLEYYEKRANVYGYDDDAARWAVLCRGVLEFVRQYVDWRPDVIVAADWQGGLIPNYMHGEYKQDPVLSKIPVVFSIHNLYYQGMFDHNFVTEMDYDDGQSEIPALTDQRMLKINFMRRGIRYADVINTVSPTYAKEITAPEYGEKLDPLLAERRSRLFGILNGIDYASNNPETDSRLEYRFSQRKLTERKKNKAVLRQKFNLPEPAGEDIPIIGIVSRLSTQKGLDLVMEVLEPLLENARFQFVVVGTGEGRFLQYFQDMDKKYDRVAAHLSYDAMLPPIVYAGADAILVPSRYEPCGLTQMEAMRYGAVPIVRKTGGLADSVEDYNPRNQTGTGFVFEPYSSFALFGAVIRALEAYHNEKVWEGLQKRAMQMDFSWDTSAKEYEKLFERAVDLHTRNALG
ncbi:MAG: glycogen/starch synthase [Patescibacteria group bacterium]